MRMGNELFRSCAMSSNRQSFRARVDAHVNAPRRAARGSRVTIHSRTNPTPTGVISRAYVWGVYEAWRAMMWRAMTSRASRSRVASST